MNIIDAAKALKQGKRVRQPHNAKTISIGVTGIESMAPQSLIVVYEKGVERSQDWQECCPFSVDSLLSEDWEIAGE